MASSQPIFVTQILCKRILIVTVAGENQPSTSNVLATAEATCRLVGHPTSSNIGQLMWKESVAVFQCTPSVLVQLAGVIETLESSLAHRSGGTAAMKSAEFEIHFRIVILACLKRSMISCLKLSASSTV